MTSSHQVSLARLENLGDRHGGSAKAAHSAELQRAGEALAGSVAVVSLLKAHR
jgi:hypothetical protein